MKFLIAVLFLGIICQALALSKCEKERRGVPKARLGGYRPTCEDDGRYHHTQCFGSTCFCVDRETGEKRQGTDDHIANIRDIERQCKTFAKRGLGACQQERDEANQSHLLGRFVPDCEADGTYKTTQCREAVCYCVDAISGEKVDGTEANVGSYGEIKKGCSNRAKRSDSKCQQERNTALSSGLIGAFAPTCEEDGSYSRFQCRESVCYCADPDSGKAIEGTHTHVSDYDQIKDQCINGFISTVELSDCQSKRNSALGSGLIGAYAPRCEDDGSYHHTQCRGSSCFCVDRQTGETRKGTEGHISDLEELERQCKTYAKRGLKACEQQRAEAQKSHLLGRFVPSCEADGTYSPVQCREAVCFCVEPETGEQIDNTQRHVSEFNDLKDDCTTNTPLAKRQESSSCKNTKTTYRWNKCPAGCKYYQGYGEALMICCCD